MTHSTGRAAVAGCLALAALSVAVVSEPAPATADAASSSVSTVSDPVGDADFKAGAFQDLVLCQLTKTAGGDLGVRMELAGAIPAAPSLPPNGNKEIWWQWAFDFDPTTSPSGTPYPENANGLIAEFIACVRWDGTEFSGILIDRRPLLAGDEATISPIPFSIQGTIVQAVLPAELIGEVPASFQWGFYTRNWSGPIGSNGNNPVDLSQTTKVSNPQTGGSGR